MARNTLVRACVTVLGTHKVQDLGTWALGSSAVAGHVIDAMTVQCVPDGDDAETDQPERHGPSHGATCAIAGLAHSDDLAGVGEGLFDSPPCGCGCRAEQMRASLNSPLSSEQWMALAAGTCVQQCRALTGRADDP
jgi:hypothetical protein